MKIKTLDLDKKLVKAGPDDGLAEGEFLVYPSTFIRQADAYGDVVAKGAFLEDLERWRKSGQVMPGLWGHRMDDPDYFVAEGHDYGEDDHGWWVKGLFDLDHPKAKQVYKLVKGRRVNQLSFAYDTKEEGLVELENGQKANELRKLQVYEFSFVPVGANQDTSVVAIKALVDNIKAGRVLSAKNETAIRDAVTSLNSVLASLDSQPAEDEDDQDKASDAGTSKEEERESANSKGQSGQSSVSRLAAIQSILERR